MMSWPVCGFVCLSGASISLKPLVRTSPIFFCACCLWLRLAHVLDGRGYWLRPVLDDGERPNYAFPSSKGFRGEVCVRSLFA